MSGPSRGYEPFGVSTEFIDLGRACMYVKEELILPKRYDVQVFGMINGELKLLGSKCQHTIPALVSHTVGGADVSSLEFRVLCGTREEGKICTFTDQTLGPKIMIEHFSKNAERIIRAIVRDQDLF